MLEGFVAVGGMLGLFGLLAYFIWPEKKQSRQQWKAERNAEQARINLDTSKYIETHKGEFHSRNRTLDRARVRPNRRGVERTDGNSSSSGFLTGLIVGDLLSTRNEPASVGSSSDGGFTGGGGDYGGGGGRDHGTAEVVVRAIAHPVLPQVEINYV